MSRNSNYNKESIGNILLFITIVVSSMFVLQICGKALFLWMQILFVSYMILNKKSFLVVKYPVINLIYIELFVSALFSFMTDMPINYKKASINMSIMAIPMYFAIAYIRKIALIQKDDIFRIIRKAIKAAVIIQLGDFYLQLGINKIMHIDINQVIFVNMLHLVDNASFIRNWSWYPSGLTWHSAVLGPLFVMGIILFDNLFIRAGFFLAAMLCGNSTCLIGVILCGALLLWRYIKKKKSNISKKTAVIMVVMIAIAVGGIIGLNLGEVIFRVFNNLWMRLFGSEKDASTAAHLSYYMDYISIFKRSSISQIIFGYGYGCSGYPITVIYNRYSGASNWAIECDIIDILVSRGIIGFFTYYYFMFYIMLKGRKLDYRYFVFMFVIFIQGFGYNIQFDYVFFIEMLLYVSIKLKLNFWDSSRNKLIQEKKRGKRYG